MNRQRRDKKKLRRRLAGRHTYAQHKKIEDPHHPGKMINVRCPKCRPLPKGSKE